MDYTGSLNVGVTLKWNYNARLMDYSTLNYMPNLLKQINYHPKDKPQHAPHPCLYTTHGQKTKRATTDNTDVQSPDEIREIKSVNGSLFH